MISLRNVWEVCEFSDEIKYGKLDRKKFAVELYDVLSGKADEAYLNPEKFLKNTYLTSDMKALLVGALKRLAKNEGSAVYVLDTEFGGGKTHSLLLLYHVFRNRNLGTQYIRQYGIDKEYGILEVPEVDVAAIDCRWMEKETLWGGLAHALGKYEALEKSDLRKTPPKNVDEIRNLFTKPTLILIDELPIYLVTASATDIKVGGTNLMELTLNFLTVLSSAVSTTNNTLLVLTLTGKQSMYERYVEAVKKRLKGKEESKVLDAIEAVHEHFTSSVSRQAQFLIPVRDVEIYRVIQKRLVKSFNTNEVKRVVETFHKYYDEKGLISDPRYTRDVMEAVYPFHPFLIDALHERVATIDKFNRTRGALWLLSLVLHYIYKNKIDCKLVTTGDVPLDDPTVRDTLTSQLGRSEYISVVNTDVIEKARKLDEHRNVKFAERIARAIYLCSLIEAAKIPGVKPYEIKFAICGPGEDPNIVDEILLEMEREFWYLYRRNGAYYFWKEPGINKVIYDYKKEVTGEEVENKITSTLKSLFKAKDKVKVVWDQSELEDKEDLRIFVSPEPLTGEDIERILSTTPSGKPRAYKNSIIFVCPDEDMLEEAKNSAREVCAIEKAQKDERIKPDKSRVKELRGRLENAKGELTASCFNAFLNVGYTLVGTGAVKIEDIPVADESARKAKNLADVVVNYLRGKMQLLESISPESVLDQVIKQVEVISKEFDKGCVKVEEIYKAIRQDRRLPYILSGSAVIEAINSGVKKELFGYADELEEVDGKFKARIGEEVKASWDGYIIRKDYVAPPKPTIPVEPGKSGSDEEPVTPKQKQTYKIPIDGYDKLASTLNAILILKVSESIECDISIAIEADGDTISIKSDLSDVNRIKRLIESIRSTYGQIKISGELEISSEEDISEELERYGLRWIS
ncbi:MAG: hypothetical protein DRN91_02185 [Candidatus Alkanophagales archaeon]|nr:MAG: hypothetical protein DRN91_02185 [Candidatus Alkanophagales archaeon]